jgi:hypothetical protein
VRVIVLYLILFYEAIQYSCEWGNGHILQKKRHIKLTSDHPLEIKLSYYILDLFLFCITQTPFKLHFKSLAKSLEYEFFAEIDTEIGLEIFINPLKLYVILCMFPIFFSAFSKSVSGSKRKRNTL